MRRVCDVTTTQAICASRDTPYKQLVRPMLDRKVSALPVVDDRHHVVGIVFEADLLLEETLRSAPVPYQDRPMATPTPCP